MNDRKQKQTPDNGGLWGRHRILILFLTAIIVLAVIGHFMFRPDRNASLQIIYTGDLQGQAAYTPGTYAGYEKIAALAEKALREGRQVLLLDVGNCLGGSEMAEIDDGHSMISLMNAVGYDAMVPGPVDFIYGTATLSSLRAEAEFPFLAANIKKPDGSNAFENYKILNIDGVRIGIIGVTMGLSQTQAARDSLTVKDPVEEVQEVIGQINGKADAIIVLAYTGNEALTESLAEIAGVTLVIESGGSEAYAKTSGSGTLITCAGKKGSLIGMADLNITRDGAEIENSFYHAALYDQLTSDEKVAGVLETVNRDRASAEALQAGTVSIPADKKTDEEMAVSIEETGIGNLTADAMLDAASGDGAVIAWIRDRSIQGTLMTGTVTRGQIGALFDDNLYMVTCKMTGGEIRSALEDSFENYPEAEDFLQVSSMTYTYDASTDIGSHLSDVMVGGHSLDDARTYIVAMTNSLADELGYSSEAVGRVSTYRTLASVLSNYIQKQASSDVTVSESEESGESDTGTGEAAEETEETKRINIIE